MLVLSVCATGEQVLGPAIDRPGITASAGKDSVSGAVEDEEGAVGEVGVA